MENRRIIVNEDPKSPVSEAYRTLRTNIQFSGIDKKIKSLVVTSSGAGEGKSTTSTNMAVAFAQNGKSVLLVDADLRKARLHKHFKVSNEKGLSKAIFEGKSIMTYAQASGIENLSLLTAGITPPNPSEMLGSQKMKDMIEDAKANFDMVIIDSPPVGFVTDGALLSSFADGTVIVAAAGQADVKATQHAKQLLENVNANILGVVLNKIPITGSGYYKYHYYSYSNDSYFDEKPKKKGLFGKRKS
ncbi:CpsD/CapB family tyrosine-protein kinase [Acidaminobacter sp. JC074]|uniref:CpsD/CapB family tyrosine-protein kinase n=1 Tax=Acidaminobacter sp. JC074 TaxID=2530199 RepID=UPI001F0D1993|nr:CpsD/CapB family tyrosine-protein kinase [Acidaminobacter sp. JC074]MCH4890313.1 CpsD/CapB family tyrosine-protein kinase [Acidaminobacter sp. JC074]